ncbi:MAG: coenzyme F420-0:L-glutamate ligase [Patescibacteria group bacterium]
MEINAFSIDVLHPPKDDLLSKIKASTLTLKEGDVIALSSKVVSIHEGRCVERDFNKKDALVQRESEWYLPREKMHGGAVVHTITNGIFIPSAGIDPLGKFYVLWPENPQKSAEGLLQWFKETYKIEKLYLILTDSRSVFLRKGVVGIALAWAGFEPLFSNKDRTDILGTPSAGSQTNIPDSIAAAATFVMGEANEQTPLVRIRNAPFIGDTTHASTDQFSSTIEEDLFEPFLKNIPWEKGERGSI